MRQVYKSTERSSAGNTITLLRSGIAMEIARRWASIALLLFMFVSVAAYGQIAGTASIQGTVTDTSGATVPQASVIATEVATQSRHTATTGRDGLYSFPNISIGTYTVQVAAPGFKTYTRDRIVLEVGSSIGVNVSLPLGESTETIQVESNGIALQTEDASFKQTIDEKSVTELPLNGRQVTGLIALAGGTVPGNGLTQGNKGFFSSVSPQIAGGQGNQVDFRLDGGDNNDYMSNTSFALPFPDAVAQFSVETAAMGAQSGLHPAGRVNVVTRSGSNQWHGSAFEFIRNNYLNASNFFSSGVKDTLHQNQFGGTVGGKVIKDKLFFFAGYQRLISKAASASTTARVPTAANLAGDFSASNSGTCVNSGVTVQLLNPKTGAILPGNKIDTGFFNTSALALSKYFPTPTDACGTVTYAIPVLQYENQFITRVDSQLTAKHNLYGRYFVDGYQTPALYSPTNVLITNNPGNTERAQTLTVGENWTVSNKMVNSIHLTATRRTNTRGPAAEGLNAASLGIDVYQPYPIGLRISGGKFTTYCSTCAPGTFNVNSFSIIDDVNLVLGKHQLVFGGEFIRVQENINNAFSSNGTFTFSGIFSQKGPAGTSAGGLVGDSTLDFLTGSMVSYQQSKPQQNALRAPIPSVYIQDTYHLGSRVVLSGGVRWGAQIWPTDYFGRGSTFSMAAFSANQHSSVYPNAPAGSLYYGDPGVSKGFAKNQWAQFSPRIGLTFDPLGDGKTVFRVGAGLVYDESNLFAASQPNYNPPYATLVNNTNLGAPIDFTHPWVGGTSPGNPFPQPTVPSASTSFSPNTQYIVYADNFKSPYVMQWTASMQHQLAHGWQFQLNYIGNKSTNQPYGFPLNRALYIAGNWTGPGSCGALTVSPGIGKPCSSTGNAASRYRLALQNPAQGAFYSGGGSGTIAMTSGSNASYNGLIVTLEHRASKSFSFLANYTWSHCISLLDNPGSFNTTAVQNPDNIHSDYGNCGFDRRGMFNSAIVAESNFGVSGWKSYVLNHWQLAPIVRATTGAPFNVTTGIDNSLTAVNNDRPDFVGGAVYTGAKPLANAALSPTIINASAFRANAIGSFGNLGRNAFIGPKFFNVDATLSRRFPIRDRLDMQLRLEAFNVMNHPNFANPGTLSINSGSFGRITSIASGSNPRLFQAAAKFTF
jgi:hypothetical protein